MPDDLRPVNVNDYLRTEDMVVLHDMMKRQWLCINDLTVEVTALRSMNATLLRENRELQDKMAAAKAAPEEGGDA
mgnify:CR=1 FL=1